MTENRFVLDTNAVIYLTNRQNEISSDVGRLLAKSRLFISVITEIELFAKQGIQPEEENNIRAFLSGIPSLNLINKIKSKTIAIRRTSKLKLPDCIVVATAVILDATLLTADDQLLKLS